jgi:hypothetical protein
MSIKENGEDLGGFLIVSQSLPQYTKDGKYLYVVRTKTGDVYTGATYYEVFVESELAVDSLDKETKVPLYKSVSVEESPIVATEIIYAENGKYFVDFTANGVAVITLVNETFIATEVKEVAESDIREAHLPKDGSTIVVAYEVTVSEANRKFIVQKRTKVVDNQTITYVYVQEMYD